MSERLSRPDVAGGFVLDGFPRTVPQAEALDALVAGGDPLIVVEMKVPDEELVRRVQGRRVCKVCGTNVSAFGGDPANVQRCEKCGGELVSRSDDTEAVVRERLKIYWRDTRPIIAYYGGRPTFRSIDGAQTPEQVRAGADRGRVGGGRGGRAPGRQGRRRPVGRRGSAGVITCRSSAELERLARVNGLVARVLSELMGAVAPGKTTRELDELAERRLREAGAVPAFKGYHGYPATICASVNEQVIHGIPNDRPLDAGDILSIDLGAKLDGFFGDSAVTVPVGPVSPEAERLLTVTKESLERAIGVVKAGARVHDIGAAVQQHVEAHGYSVVREFVGHGIGTSLHEEPQIPNYGTPGRGSRLAEGMVLAIEPMVNAGKPAVKVLSDGWTAVTKDGSLSAHFEHTVAVTETGCRVLTLRDQVVAGAV